MAVKLLFGTLLVLALAWGWAHFCAARHEDRAEAAFPPEGQLITVDGHQVHAVVMGPGHGGAPDLVLIHGSGGNTRDLTFDLAPKLAEGYRVIVFDRPGMGYSDPINGAGASIVQQARLLAATARQLGARKPVVVGHSYGGAVALAWAVHEPGTISALVTLAAPANPWDSGLPVFYRITANPVLGPLVTPFLTAFVHDERVETATAGVFAPDPVPPGYLEHFGAGLTLRRASLRANARQRANLLAQIEALHSRYGEITVPTEIVHGTADTTVSLSIHADPLSRQIPGARLTRLEGIGHMPHHGDPQAVIAAIDRAAARAGLRPAR